jgi:hypothetical protein
MRGKKKDGCPENPSVSVKKASRKERKKDADKPLFLLRYE